VFLHELDARQLFKCEPLGRIGCVVRIVAIHIINVVLADDKLVCH